MFENYDIPDTDEMEFNIENIRVPVVVQQYEEDYKGTSRDEEYFEETLVDTKTVSVKCPLQFLYNNSNPDEEYEQQDAIEFLTNNNIDSFTIKDAETVELQINGILYIASYDAGELAEYDYF